MVLSMFKKVIVPVYFTLHPHFTNLSPVSLQEKSSLKSLPVLIPHELGEACR